MKTLLPFLLILTSSIVCQAQMATGRIHLRITYSYSSSYLIELDSTHQGCNGSVKMYTDEYVEQPAKPTGRHYDETFHLNPLIARKIIKLYFELKVGQTNEWESGLDGTEYDIDFTDKQGTSHRKFWNPDERKPSQSNVRAFVDSVHLLLTKTESIFRSHNPFECNYVKDSGGDVECRALNNKQKRKYKAERENFRKSQRSSIQ